MNISYYHTYNVPLSSFTILSTNIITDISQTKTNSLISKLPLTLPSTIKRRRLYTCKAKDLP